MSSEATNVSIQSAADLQRQTAITSPSDLHFLLAWLAPSLRTTLMRVPGRARALLFGFWGHYRWTDAVTDAVRAHPSAEMAPYLDVLITREGKTNLIEARVAIANTAPIELAKRIADVELALAASGPLHGVGTVAYLAAVDRAELGRVVGEHQAALDPRDALSILPYLAHPLARTVGVEALFDRMLAGKLSVEERHFAAQHALACGLSTYAEHSREASGRAKAASERLGARLKKGG